MSLYNFKCHKSRMKRSTFIMYAGLRYFCSSLFFTHRKGAFLVLGGALSARMALKKNTFVPIEFSVRTALGSLYLYTPQGALPRKVALKPAAAGRKTGCEFMQMETKVQMLLTFMQLLTLSNGAALCCRIPVDHQCLTPLIKVLHHPHILFLFCAATTTHFLI